MYADIRSESVRARMAQELLVWMAGGNAPDRSLLALYGVAQIKSFLKAGSWNWRHGFAESPEEVAADAAHLAISDLLKEEPHKSAARPSMPLLHKCLQSVLALQPRIPASIETEPRQERASGEMLRALDIVLRTRGRQAHMRMWKERHPEHARLLRQLKSHIKRSGGLHLVHDARGQFVCAPRADLRQSRIPRETLRRHVYPSDFLLLLKNCGQVLTELLISEGHGRYCYLMDLVHVIHELRRQLYERDWIERLSAGFAHAQGHLSHRSAGEWRRWLFERAFETGMDQEKRRSRRSEAAIDESSVRIFACVAAEMVARKIEAGKPEYAEFSQRQLLLHLLPPPPDAANLETLRRRTDYLVRCLMMVLEADLHAGMGKGPTHEQPFAP